MVAEYEYQVIEIKTSAEIALVTFKRTDFRSPESREFLDAELERFVGGTRCKYLILDFSGVRFLPSSVIAMLLVHVEEGKGKGLDVRLCALEKEVAVAFELLNVDRLVPIYETRMRAIDPILNVMRGIQKVDVEAMLKALNLKQGDARLKKLVLGVVLTVIGCALIIHHFISTMPPGATPPIMDVICTETGWEGTIRIDGDWRVCPETGKPTLKLAAACPNCKKVVPFLDDEYFLQDSYDAVKNHPDRVFPMCEECNMQCMPKWYVNKKVVRIR